MLTETIASRVQNALAKKLPQVVNNAANQGDTCVVVFVGTARPELDGEVDTYM